MTAKKNPLKPSPRAIAVAYRFWSQPNLRQWLRNSTRVALGVSGGADSMALLYLMAGPFERPTWAPVAIAAHVNHNLRDAESDADQNRVYQLAALLNVEFHHRCLDGEKLRSKAGGSLEQSARHARYAALKSILHETRCEALVLAHHQDDLAETFLMRLLRGSGLTGLGGFGPESEVEGIPVIRPLIDWTRAELRQLVRNVGIDWGEDATNRDISLIRNRIRHRVLPYLEHMTDHPPAVRMLARTARRLEREGKVLQSVIEKTYRENRQERGDLRRVGIPREAVLRDDALFAPYLLRMLFCDVLESSYPPSEERTLELLRFVQETKPNTLLQTERNVVVWMSEDEVLWAYHKPTRKISRQQLLEEFRKK